MDQALNSQKTPHTSPLRASYGMSFVSILMKNDRVIKGFYCTQLQMIFFNVWDIWLAAEHWWWILYTDGILLPCRGDCFLFGWVSDRLDLLCWHWAVHSQGHLCYLVSTGISESVLLYALLYNTQSPSSIVNLLCVHCVPLLVLQPWGRVMGWCHLSFGGFLDGFWSWRLFLGFLAHTDESSYRTDFSFFFFFFFQYYSEDPSAHLENSWNLSMGSSGYEDSFPYTADYSLSI